jgi:hypothetical protein
MKHDLRAHALTIATIVAGVAVSIGVPILLGKLYVALAPSPSSSGEPGFVVLWMFGLLVTATILVSGFGALLILAILLDGIYMKIYNHYLDERGESDG